MSSKNIVEFNEKFKTDEYIIYETMYWKWSLRPDQVTLGAGILSLKRECERFSALKVDEFTDLNNIIKIIEKNLLNIFEYNQINYLMLMMVDSQVHYHIIPRYDSSREKFSLIWHDKSWPGVPDLTGGKIEREVIELVLSFIKKNINTKI